MKITLKKVQSKVWRWRVGKYGGYCRTKADALNDASFFLPPKKKDQHVRR